MHNADRFKALGDPIRLALLHLIRKHEGQLSVAELVNKLCDQYDCYLAQPTISYHLLRLTDADFIEGRRDGLYTYYQLKDGALISLLDALRELAREEVRV